MKRILRLNPELPMKVVTRSSSSTIRISKPSRTRPELSCLPKAPEIRSIRFKRTTPGVAARLLLGPASTPPINISHPLSRLPAQQLRRIVPQYQCSLFVVHAYPHAVLSQFDEPEFYKQLKDRDVSSEMRGVLDHEISEETRQSDNALAAAMESSGDRRRAKHTLPISLVFVVSKKSVHKSAVLRTKIKIKFREALSLVVVRGATAGTEPGTHPTSERRIIFKTPEGVTKKDGQDGLVLQGWTYIIRPSLEIYRCPLPALVEDVRKALVRIKSQADILERKWAAEKRPQRSQREKDRQNKAQPPLRPDGIGERQAKTSRNPTRRLPGSDALGAEGDIRGAARPLIYKQGRSIALQKELGTHSGRSKFSKPKDADQQGTMRTTTSDRILHERQAGSTPPRHTQALQDAVHHSQKPPLRPHHAADTAQRLLPRSPPLPPQSRTAPEAPKLPPEPGSKPSRRLFKSPTVTAPPRADSGRRHGGGSQNGGGRGVR